MRFGAFYSGVACMVILSAFTLFADAIVDDCEGKNQNKFGYYWFFFDDANDGGGSTLPGITKTGKEYNVAMSTGGHSGNCLALPYKLGPKATTGKFNYVGCGTMLSADGLVLDITGATAFTFWVKSQKATIVDFIVLTKEITDYGYHHLLVSATTEWTQAVVSVADLKVPSWGKGGAFSPKSVTKLQWQMHTDNVGKDSSGTVWIDDIGITGYNFIGPDQCPTCAADPGVGAGALLSNLDVAPLTKNARGYFWFCYNDSKNHSPAVASPSDFSQILSGATIDLTDFSKDPTIVIDEATKRGYNGSQGAYLQFTLGPAFKQVGDTANIVKPFVGMGTLLSNNGTATDAYDATLDGATGIYFDYMLSSTSATTELKLEVYANDFAKAGVVHYIRLPATCGAGQSVWKGATIPFAKLKLPAWDGVDQTAALDATKMKKLQWAVQDIAGTQCELAIDNVYLLGATKISSLNSVKFSGVSVPGAAGISVSILKNQLKVRLPARLGAASIGLIDPRGSVAAKSVRTVGRTALINTNGLAGGVYILEIKETAGSGQTTCALPITIH
jgi:hypothetical protein